MTYCYTDFWLLYALSEKKGKGLGDVLARVLLFNAVTLSEEAVNHGLTVLRNGGYIHVPGEGDPVEVDASCAVKLTDKGRSAVRLSLGQRLFGREKGIGALEKAFLTHPAVPDGGRVRLAPHAYEVLMQSVDEPEDNGADRSFVTVRQTEDGTVMTLRIPWDMSPEEANFSEDEYIIPNKLTVTSEDGDTVPVELLGTVHRLLLAAESKTRKVCISGREGVWVLTLSPQDSEIRVSCEPIRFNQKRFRGKIDNELDYAQCGDKVLSFLLDETFVASLTASAYAEVWELLPPAVQEQAMQLHEAFFTLNMN